MSAIREFAKFVSDTKLPPPEQSGAALAVEDASDDGGVVSAGRVKDDQILDFVCRVTIVNETNTSLQLKSQQLDSGHYQIRPPGTVPPRQALAFTVADKHLVGGTATYNPTDGQQADWIITYEFVPSFRPGGPHSKISVELNQSPTRFADDQEDDGDLGLRFTLKQLGPPPAPQSFVSRVLVVNDTSVVLQKSAQNLTAGTFAATPPQAIPPGQAAEFEVQSQAAQGQRQAVAGSLSWSPAGNSGSETWTFDFAAATGVKGTANSNITSDRFTADDPDIKNLPQQPFRPRPLGNIFKFRLRDNDKPPPPPAGSFVSHVIVENDTDVVLNKVEDLLLAGSFEVQPQNTVAPGEQMEFTVRSQEDPATGDNLLAGSVTWRPDGAGDDEDWFTQYFMPSDSTKRTASSIINSNRFTSGSNTDGSFFFFLKANPKPPPPTLSCQITITNNTQFVLTLTNQSGDPDFPIVGDFAGSIASTLQPGDSTSFGFVQSSDQVGKSSIIQGCLSWDVDSPAVTSWRTEWVHPLGATKLPQRASHTLNPDSGDFTSADQIGSGDANVPVSFALSGGPDPVPPDEPFNPPKPAKQPTLRKNDPNNDDGWVEYLQEQLNAQLDPSPNLPLDGQFTGDVDKAVKAFQTKAKESNPGFIVDGIVGDQTWAALRHGTPETPHARGHATDKGFKARWLTEDEVATYDSSADILTLKLVSVGTEDLQSAKVHVFVALPGAQPPGRGKAWPIDPNPIQTTQTGEGDVHQVKVLKFRKAYGVPADVNVPDCRVEAYFDQALGGDIWSTDKGKIAAS
jgi:hypothetical protein